MAASEADESDDQDLAPAEALGAKLRDAREAQDLSLEAVSSELRIATHFLEALEQGRFDVLGAPVFAKGHLKQYGSKLGLDVGELSKEFDAAVGAPAVQVAPSNTISLRDDRQITVWAISGAALVVVAGVLSIWWWLGTREQPVQETIVFESVPVPDLSEPVAEPEPEPVSEPEPVRESDASLDARETDGLAQTPTSALPLPQQTEPSQQGGAAVDSTGADAADLTDGEAGEALSLAPPYDGPELEVVFREDSWTEIWDAEDTRLYYDLGRAGTSVSVPADRVLNLFFGNAAGVELSMEGEAIPIPARARRGDLAQFTLDLPPDSNP